MNTYALRSHALTLDGPILGEKSYNLRIKDMPAEDKPREKLLKYGPDALSLPELLAVILGTGTINEDVMSMSARIMKNYGERSVASRRNAAELAKDLEIPETKALQIVACAEIGRRLFERKDNAVAIIRTPRDVYEYLADMRNLPKEHLRGIYLNTHHRVIHDETISIGTLDSSLLHPREVFRPGIEYGAAALVLAHNHPSGSTDPSAADVEITKQLVAVGKMVGIPLVDHVIVAKDSYASIKISYE